MEKITNSLDGTCTRMYEDERRLIQQRFDMFRSLIAQTRDFAQGGKYNAAAAYGEIAALYAIRQHCGLFVSPELEQVLLMIGRKAIQRSLSPSKSTSLHGTPRNVLHVATHVKSIGGHSRLLWRWIQQDTERSHSVVLTRQRLIEVPKILRDAVINSHGKIYVLDERIGSIVYAAKRLRKYAASADMVVLHTSCEDVIPTIAFANKEQSPPVIFVNHADHCFWLGAGISDVVANLRESGMHLSRERRGIETERNVLLPTILSPTHRILSRSEAKRQLGLAETSVVLLSIARTPKYRTIDGISFADAHVPLLERHDRAILIVIGPDNSEDWSAAVQRTQGRIKIFGECKDTAVFYQAADIYVDSFPIVSITSLLEAGSYGVPLVSRYPYSASDILGADMPGLAGNLVRARDLEEYTAVLSRLVDDEEFRLCLGEATRRQIADIHTGSNWQQSLQDVYVRATTMPRVTVKTAPVDQIFLGEPDVFLPRVFAQREDMELDEVIEARLGIMPLAQRLRIWINMVKMRGFRGRMGLLLPDFYLAYYSRLRSLLPF